MKLQRRSDVDVKVDDVLREATDFELVWPSKTFYLEKNSTVEVRLRSTSPSLSVAELYHENSKLFPEIAGQLAAASLGVTQFRRATFAGAKVKTPPKSALTDSVITQLLSFVTARIDLELYYALELRILVGDAIFLYNPAYKVFSRIKTIAPIDKERLRCAVNLILPLMTGSSETYWVFIVGRFARNALLFGDRGYRRTVLEAGSLLSEILRGAEHLGVKGLAAYEFTDRDVDAILEVDGVEDGTLVAVRLTV